MLIRTMSLVFAVFALVSSGCRAAPFDVPALQSAVESIAERAQPGHLGVAVRDLESGETWSRLGTQRLPMQSVFKLPLGVVVLAAVHRGELSLTDTVRLTSADLSPPFSPITCGPGQRSAAGAHFGTVICAVARQPSWICTAACCTRW